MKKYWKDTWQYQRILEILEDYWLTEPDEKFVCVDLYFEHKNGMHQEKSICWTNPAIDEDIEEEDIELDIKTIEELMKIEFVGRDRGGCLELVRNEEGIPIGVKNDRTGVIDYFKKVEKK